MRPLSLALTATFIVAAIPGCIASHSCTLLDCQNVVSVQYTRPVADGYVLTVKSSGVTASVTCPTTKAPLGASQGVFVQCDANGFELTSSSETAPASGLQASVTPQGSNTAALVPVTTSAASSSQPNGPSCAPTCTTYKGSLSPSGT
jgi:hypothetical protein